MSDKFDAYDYIAVIAPGTVIVTGLFFLYVYNGQKLSKDELGIGDLGFVLILAFVFGHLLQTIGNVMADAFWCLNGGMPTEWIINPKQKLITPHQMERLSINIQNDFHTPLLSLPRKDWLSITRELYIKLQAKSKVERIDKFNRIYGLMRGIAAAFLTLTVLILIKDYQHLWQSASLCLLAFFMALYRMHKFAIHYGAEIFIAYIS